MATEDKLILNPSLYHARPHLGNKDYLHYWIFHAPGIFEEAKKFGQRSEINILGHAKAKITRARKKQLLELENANPDVPLESLQDVENILLKSDWLKDFSTVINNTPAPSFSMPSTQEILDNGGPLAVIEDAEQAFEQISQAFQKLEEDIKKSLEKKSNADIEKYEEVLTAYFLNGYSTASKKKKYTVQGSSDVGLTDWQSKVLESILSRNNEGFFSASNKAQYKKEFQDISGEKAKLLAIIKIFNEGREPVLKYIKDLALKKVKLRHQNTTKVEELKTSQEVLDALFDKIGKYYQQLHAIAAEAATGEALKNLLEEFKDTCGDSLTVDIKKDIGSKQLPVTITSNFQGNKKLFDLVETQTKKSAWDYSTFRTSKSDSRFDITRNGVTVTQGFTVKDYQEYSINPKLNKATIDLQKGTPLLTLLTREANLNPAKMHMIYQILSAHADESDSGVGTTMLSYTWNNIVKKAQYLAFLDTLAGFTNEQDKAFYFVFERNIYTLYDILSYLQANDHYIDSVKWSDLRGEAGLEYSTYHNLDQWVGKKWRANPEFAEKRSESTTKYISQWMYEAKIRVKLHIADLAAFRNLALK